MRFIPMYAFLFLVVLSACSQRSAEELELLDKAYSKQQEAIELLEDIEQSQEQSQYPQADSLSVLVEELEESLFAIPGHELNLSGHEGHDHSHGRIELSPEEILAVQEELVKQLLEIKNIIANE